jgi:hypothetical protein
LRKQFPKTFTASYVWCDVHIEQLQTRIVPADDIIEWPAHLLFEERNLELSRVEKAPPNHSFLPSRKCEKLAAKTEGSDHTMSWRVKVVLVSA